MSEVRTIKRYRNRRLYDTHEKTQITLTDVRALVKAGVDFRIEENDTGRDLTMMVLSQVLGDELKHINKWDETGDVLKLLIQRGGSAGMTILSKTVMAAIGALAITKENAEKFVDELIKRGELEEGKRGEAVREAVEKAETKARETVTKVKESATAAKAKETVHKVAESISNKVKEARDQVTRMRPASSEDVSKLQKTIEELEVKLEELKSKLD